MEKDTILFDLDGTLLNTMGDLTVAFNYAIGVFGFPARTLDELQSFVGNGVDKAIELALPCKVDEATFKKIYDEFVEYYRTNMTVETKPYDGICEMLGELKQKGYKLGVISNKYDSAVKELCMFYFSEYIDVAIGEGGDVVCKPDTSGVEKACRLLDSDLSRAIYIGDADTDINTAKNGGMPCISVLWGYRDKEFLVKNGGKLFVEEPKDIIKIIEKKLYLM